MRTIGMHLASVAARAVFSAETGSGSGGEGKSPDGQAGASGVTVENGGEAAKTYSQAGSDAAGQAGAPGITVENGGEAAKTYPQAGGDAAGVDNNSASTSDNGAAPATDFNPSGAPNQVVSDVDPSHPAVDNDPRANTTADQNRIDFNDPYMSGAEASARNLADQAKG